MHTLTVNKQTTQNRGLYTKYRLQIPLPKKTRCKQYSVVLDDEANAGILYGKSVEPWRIQTAMIPVSPIGASVGLIIDLLVKRKVQVDYLGITGSLARGDYVLGESDVDFVLVVSDDDVSKLRNLPSELSKSIDLFIIPRSKALSELGSGLDRLALVQAQPILDRIDVHKILEQRAIDWAGVKWVLEAELDFLDSGEEMIHLATTREERVSCSYHLMLRLRAVHLVECLIQEVLPRKDLLYRSLEHQRISARLIRKLHTTYVIGRDRQVCKRSVHVPSRKELLLISDAIRRYGVEVKEKIGSKEKLPS
jgi:hypothetical protein